jgi:L-asparaginase / beta-aspartyl-peptidase
VAQRTRAAGRIAVAIHGGAGTIRRAALTPALEHRYRQALQGALCAGFAVLARGGTSIDAVVAAVVVLEDSPLFNAGRGAVFNSAAQHELDAAVMDGARLTAGAVVALRRAKNPVRVARAVMEATPHVMLAGAGADRFARARRLEMVRPEYFSTVARRAALARAKAQKDDALSEAERHGTVGAVALDRHGNLAAATSTGGLTNKMTGRVGDSPLIGAGTYADNASCAVSATGDGECFIRCVLAHDVAARMRYLGEPLSRAAKNALDQVSRLGGTGGLVALDPNAHIVMPFTSEGMYRGWMRGEHDWSIDIFRAATTHDGGRAR